MSAVNISRPVSVILPGQAYLLEPKTTGKRNVPSDEQRCCCANRKSSRESQALFHGVTPTIRHALRTSSREIGHHEDGMYCSNWQQLERVETAVRA